MDCLKHSGGILEPQQTIHYPAGGAEVVTGRPVAGDIWKPSNVASEKGPAKIASGAILGGIWASVLLLAATMFPGVIGGGATAILVDLNDKFDRVWCPLPTWAHIVLVIAAWALFFRVGKDFLKTVRRQHGNQ